MSGEDGAFNYVRPTYDARLEFTKTLGDYLKDIRHGFIVKDWESVFILLRAYSATTKPFMNYNLALLESDVKYRPSTQRDKDKVFISLERRFGKVNALLRRQGGFFNNLALINELGVLYEELMFYTKDLFLNVFDDNREPDMDKILEDSGL